MGKTYDRLVIYERYEIYRLRDAGAPVREIGRMIHSPWQRGPIENANGIFRRDMPRETDLSNCSARDFANLVWATNSNPRNASDSKPPPKPSSTTSTVALEMRTQRVPAR